jgi:large subunit ribosomal protein L18
MNKQIRKNESAARRVNRDRAKVSGTTERPRLAVRRSLAHIYAQVIDDTTGKTLAAASDADVKEKLNKTDMATAVGKLVAERAKAAKVTTVVFDRRDKKFHGRVAALAEGARAAGLIF